MSSLEKLREGKNLFDCAVQWLKSVKCKVKSVKHSRLVKIPGNVGLSLSWRTVWRNLQ